MDLPGFLASSRAAAAAAAAPEWIVGYFAASASAVAFTPVFLAVSLVRACSALERARSTSSCVGTAGIWGCLLQNTGYLTSERGRHEFGEKFDIIFSLPMFICSPSVTEVHLRSHKQYLLPAFACPPPCPCLTRIHRCRSSARGGKISCRRRSRSGLRSAPNWLRGKFLPSVLDTAPGRAEHFPSPLSCDLPTWTLVHKDSLPLQCQVSQPDPWADAVASLPSWARPPPSLPTSLLPSAAVVVQNLLFLQRSWKQRKCVLLRVMR